MMTETEKRLRIDLELLYNKWMHELASHVRNNTQPTRDDERAHLLELKKIIVGDVASNPTKRKEIIRELIKDLD